MATYKYIEQNSPVGVSVEDYYEKYSIYMKSLGIRELPVGKFNSTIIAQGYAAVDAIWVPVEAKLPELDPDDEGYIMLYGNEKLAAKRFVMISYDAKKQPECLYAKFQVRQSMRLYSKLVTYFAAKFNKTDDGGFIGDIPRMSALFSVLVAEHILHTSMLDLLQI